MRSIAEIKKTITDNFMNNKVLSEKYGYNVGDDFDNTFSAVSIESIMFYIIAAAMWVSEGLFDVHKNSVDAAIEDIIPHRPKWYRDKVLQFMSDYTLIEDTDVYDIDNLTDDEISNAQVVKYATATESADSSLLIIKVAGEDESGHRITLNTEIETQLSAYIAEIKDAGVRINLINKDADEYYCSLDVYYDAQLLATNVEESVRTVIKNYVENLPFNGLYTNMALVDELQKVDGVKIVDNVTASAMVSDVNIKTTINAKCIPDAGYFQTADDNIKIKMIPYNESI